MARCAVRTYGDEQTLPLESRTEPDALVKRAIGKIRDWKYEIGDCVAEELLAGLREVKAELKTLNNNEIVLDLVLGIQEAQGRIEGRRSGLVAE
jgi:hypothetical protein